MSGDDAPAPPAAGPAGELAQDARALRRGVLVNALGNASKLSFPVLLAFATRAYGTAPWGVFVTLQAFILIMARVGTLGLDKAMLWWVASRTPAEADAAFAPALVIAAAWSSLLAAVAIASGEVCLRLWDLGDDALAPFRVMLLGLPLFVTTEVLLNACMGRQRMEPQVIVRDTLVPMLQIALALLLAFSPWRETGLAWSFVLANGIGLGVASVFRARLFRGRPDVTSRTLPRELWRYGIPTGLADLSNSLLLRLDIMILATLTDPVTVGVWGIVSQFGNAIRQIRRAFDPIVVAVSAGIARAHDARRLVAATSYAAQLVTLTQLPVFAFLFAFSDLLLPLYGPDFARGTTPVLILCGFWLVNGAAGLSGVVLSGYGHATLGLMLVWLTLLVQSALLYLLAPRYGLAGAALAIGLSYTVQNAAQILLLRQRVGTFVFSSRSLQPLRAAVPAVAAACVFLGVLGAQPEWWKRSLPFAGFFVVYAGLVFRDYRRGRLAAADA